MAVFSFDNVSQSLELTTANLTVFDQASGNQLYTTELGANTNSIAIRDGFDYRLMISKNGYTSIDANYSNAELKAFATDQLEVVLQATGLLPSNTFADSGQAFSTEGTDAVSGDLDGDGDIDLFVSQSSGRPSEVWLNDVTGNFSNSGQDIGNYNSSRTALGDLDGDGDLDAFEANYGNQANRVWINDGTGTFTDSGQTLGNYSSLYVSLGDIDGDGDLDAIVGNDASIPNTVWFNDGTGNFTESSQNLGTSTAYGLDLGDVDGDGDLDLFVANINEANELWYNDGSGTFTHSGQSLGNERSIRVALSDLDGDGDLDAFVGSNRFNSSPQPSRVLFNDGSGNFTDSGQALADDNVRGLIMVDFDLDGDVDALTVSYYNEPYGLWLNDGSGSFSNRNLSFGTHFGTGVTHADYDGDGDQDFFVTHSGESHKLWLGEQN
uniref:FG-GAP repeat domain-containing protein n=2 Tax=Roseivirga sp. TaxID=1964215 RepID=UPI0040473EF4